eukprot:1667601-Heterocapsa_arctica.AAC.1
MLCSVCASSATAMTRLQSSALWPIMPHLKQVPENRTAPCRPPIVAAGRVCRRGGCCCCCWARGGPLRQSRAKWP